MADTPNNFQSDPNMKGSDITEEEAEALDKLWTETTPKVKANGTGFVSRREARLMGFDTLTMDYLITKAEATHKTPAQIVGELVRKELKAAM
jgi:hypothetical protein